MDFLDKYDKHIRDYCNELSQCEKLKTGYKNKRQLQLAIAIHQTPKYKMRQEAISNLKDRIMNPIEITAPNGLGIKLDFGTDQELRSIDYIDEEGLDSPRASAASDEFAFEPTPPPAPSRGGARRGAGRPSNAQRQAAAAAGIEVRDVREIDMALEDIISEAEQDFNIVE